VFAVKVLTKQAGPGGGGDGGGVGLQNATSSSRVHFAFKVSFWCDSRHLRHTASLPLFLAQNAIITLMQSLDGGAGGDGGCGGDGGGDGGPGGGDGGPGGGGPILQNAASWV